MRDEPSYDWGTTQRFVGAQRAVLDVVLDVNEQVVREAIAGAAIDAPVAAIGLVIDLEFDEPIVVHVGIETERTRARLGRPQPPLDGAALRAFWDGYNYPIDLPVDEGRFDDPAFVVAAAVVREAIGDLKGLDRCRVALVELVQRLIDRPPLAGSTTSYVVFVADRMTDELFSMVRYTLPDATQRELERTGYLVDVWPRTGP